MERVWRRTQRKDIATGGKSIAEAVDILLSARRGIQRLNGTPTYTRPFEESHNAMCDAEALLEERDFEEDEEDETEESN